MVFVNPQTPAPLLQEAFPPAAARPTARKGTGMRRFCSNQRPARAPTISMANCAHLSSQEPDGKPRPEEALNADGMLWNARANAQSDRRSPDLGRKPVFLNNYYGGIVIA